ncbi:MAG: hypothetical protein ACFB50_07145 [Rubrobacteraceae bacterium]
MSYGTAQLIFLIIFLGAMATVVIGTFVFTTLVDRSLAKEGAQGQSREARQNKEKSADEDPAEESS